MADLKRWFKVWTSVLVDMDHLPPEAIGRWVRLGARIALVGNRGTVRFESRAHAARFLTVADEETVITVLEQLPGIHVEEGQNRDGDLTVTMSNWHKYQHDSTASDRMKTLRSKRRGEEKRGDEKREEENHPPLVPPPGDVRFEAFWTAYPKHRQIGKGKAEAAWRKLRPSAMLTAAIVAAVERQKAGARWQEHGGQFVPLPTTWLNQRRWEDTVMDGPILFPAGLEAVGRRFLERHEGEG